MEGARTGMVGKRDGDKRNKMKETTKIKVLRYIRSCLSIPYLLHRLIRIE
jgi:hypothetical protein